MNSIQRRWEEYRRTLPLKITQQEIIEARLGFFNGASSIYFMMMNKAMDMDVTQLEGEEFLASLGDEIDKFMKKLVSDKDVLERDITNAR